ncbi:MAG: hypothetical protein HY815_28695 [Candidatus Riflebacteria bacterium]|nr:hypothetical protein [Candidatus Riflebacteria bacterium]
MGKYVALFIGMLAVTAGVCLAVENPGTKAGWQYLKEGDYARAERVFEQVLAQDPQDMKAWEGYRVAFQKRKAQEEGRADDDSSVPDATADEAKPSGTKKSAASTSKPKRAPKKNPEPVEPAAEESSVATSEPEARSSRSEPEPDAAKSDPEEQGSKPESREEIGKLDARALHNVKKARERFDKLRKDLSETYRRQHSGATEINATFYSRELYRALVERLGAEKGYKYDKAQKLYEATIRDMKGQLEFYVKLTNYSSKPKVTVSLADVAKRTCLVDDEGNTYEPARWKGPKNEQLVAEDAYTVWFSRTDSEGEDIVKKAGKGNLYLTISDLPREVKQIQVPFAVAKLSPDRGKSTERKSLMDKVKDWWR